MPSPRPAQKQEIGIAKAIRIAGGQAALAQKLNAFQQGERVTQQAISEWARKGFCPQARVMQVYECTDRRVPPITLLSPDLRDLFLSIMPPAVPLTEPAMVAQ